MIQDQKQDHLDHYFKVESVDCVKFGLAVVPLSGTWCREIQDGVFGGPSEGGAECSGSGGRHPADQNEDCRPGAPETHPAAKPEGTAGLTFNYLEASQSTFQVKSQVHEGKSKSSLRSLKAGPSQSHRSSSAK